MRDREGRRLPDGGMRQQGLLDVVGRDLLSPAIYNLLLARDDLEISAPIQHPEVAGREPTIGQARRGCINIVAEVPRHHARSPQHDLARLSGFGGATLRGFQDQLALGYLAY